MTPSRITVAPIGEGDPVVRGIVGSVVIFDFGTGSVFIDGSVRTAVVAWFCKMGGLAH